MDWLLKNPQIIVFLAFFVIVTLANRSAAKKARAAKEARQRQQNAAPSTAANAAATDEARVRQTQEEIRRKILARMQTAGTTQPQRPVAMPRPTEPTITRTAARSIPRATTTAIRPPPLPFARQMQAATASTLAQNADPSESSYREATAELEQLEAMRKNAEANRDAGFAPDTATAAAATLDEINASLHTPDTLRRAILLREILDTPLGLR